MTHAATPQINLKKILAGAQLPALPQSAIRLLELSQDPANGPAEFAVPIESDPGLTGQVLRFVNSSYFGFSREISSIKLAITLVGIRTIKNFALWSAVFSLMPNPKCGPFDLKSLWQDSLRRALFARAAAKLLGMKEAEEPFAAALLQDMAVPLLAKEAPRLYVKLLEARDEGKIRLSFLEEQAVRLDARRSGGHHGPAVEPARRVRPVDRAPPGHRPLGRAAHGRAGPPGGGAVGACCRRWPTRCGTSAGCSSVTTSGSLRPAPRPPSTCWRRSTWNSPSSPRY